MAASAVIGIVIYYGHLKSKRAAAGKAKVCFPLFRGSFFLLFFLLGMQRFAAEETFRTVQNKAVYDACAAGKEVTVQGRLSGKEPKGEQYSYYLDACYISIGHHLLPCNQILIYQNTDEHAIGQTLILTGKIELWKPAVNDGNFDAKAFYESKKVDFWVKNAVIGRVYGTKETFGELLYSFRKSVRGVYTSYMKEEDAGVLAAMTLGDKSMLDADVKKMYQKAGISHILAISGLHISVIGMGLYRMLRKMKFSFLTAGILSFFVLAGYGMMSGLCVSTVRAVLMFGVMLFGEWIGRSYDSLSALSLAAVILLWENPYLLWYAGFVLSFAAVLGITAIGQTLLKIKKPYFSVSKNFLVSFSIQMATVPVTAYYFYEVPLWSMFVNFLILPLMGALLLFGILGGLFGLLFPVSAKCCFFICHTILLFYEKICLFYEKLPNATLITGQPDAEKLFFFYAAAAALLFFMKRKMKRTGFVPLGILLLCIVLKNPVSGFELNVLDVGQGDGSFIHTQSGATFFFDGGSTDIAKVGIYRILPFLKAKGVKRIDYWVVSHTDADHISGLCEILEEGYEVKNLVFSQYIPEDEAYKNLTELAKMCGTDVLKMESGDVITDGTMKLKCLFPDAGYKSEDKNALSLVMRFEESGFSGIFTGDIGLSEETYLLQKGEIGQTVFYKAAHHGSKSSNSAPFLTAISPAVSVISCGEKNRYGHPGKEAVQNISESGSRIFYTMESGRIRIRMEEGTVTVDTYLTGE